MHSTSNIARVVCRGPRGWRSRGRIAAVFALLAIGPVAQAEIEVTTVGGGPLLSGGAAYGDIDGKTLEQSQFHTPVACAMDSLGYLFVADRDNGKIRRLDTNQDRTKTYISGLASPVDVAVDGTNNLYVLSQGSGTLGIYDSFGYPVSTQAWFLKPTAMVLDGTGNVYVAEFGGTLKKTTYAGGPASVVLTGLSQPQGLAFLPNGTLAISEAGSSVVSIWDLSQKTAVKIIGNGAGFQDGPVAVAKFNQPQRLACAPSGALLIADQGNHRVRTLSTGGRIGTLYGLAPEDWGYDHLDNYLGWWDGTAEVAEARDPVGVTTDSKGVVYTTEIYYHLIRTVTGAGLGDSGGGGGGSTNEVQVTAPVISPTSGYFPMGQTIEVFDSNSSLLFERAVYYTTDGTEPTTNSTRLTMEGNVGSIPWRETQNDLTSLRVRTFLGTAVSATVSGTLPEVNEIGVHRDVLAGAGATVAIPITLALNGNNPLKSLQFRVEIAPSTASTPPFGTNFTPMDELTNTAYFTLASPADSGDTASFLWSGYDNGSARGLAIAYLSTNSLFHVEGHAVVAMLKATVPAEAVEGDRYQIQVFQVSGTSDGGEKEVAITPLLPVGLIVTNIAYRVGDTAPGGWYNAGDYGDPSSSGFLSNSDVNNAYNAAFGNRVPYAFTDLFDALDAFPLDSDVAAGGDGQIRFLDWQIILCRSLGLDTTDWSNPWRNWSGAGRRPALGHGLAAVPAQRSRLAVEDAAWFRQVRVQAQPVGYAKPGTTVDVPFSVVVQPGFKVGGMQFRVSVVPAAGSPAILQAPEFVAVSGFAGPTQNAASGKDLLCAWSLTPSPGFTTPLQGSNWIGYLRLAIPANANGGARYTLHFSYVDASPDMETQYECESCPGSVTVGAAAAAAETVSDEWKVRFFGSYTDARAAADADPDGDGFSNREEYVAGLNPNAADWRYQGLADGIQLRWFGETGRAYQVESSVDLREWTAVGAPWQGAGNLLEYTGRSGADRVRFYRVRIAP
jgi:hypothetical protein